ncbi:hypothetical protein [Leptobacterium sp. I13]|uniref:hypothetical protein n=1 Tax=Leptobacterium meishanense TaxID=3128904 RepID=UPI0030EC0937
MKAFSTIQKKLEQFITKYYTNELFKGIMLFFAIGLMYFLLTLFIEYFLWLSKTGRAILFWAFIGIEFFLFLKLIAIPIFKILRLRNGITQKEAAKYIGRHFKEVDDKLLNILQLSEKGQKEKSDLLLASIEQKSSSLRPIPFNVAIDFKKNIKYVKYIALPVLIIISVWASGNSMLFSSSYKRVVNYNIAYEPPAPFYFYLLNDSLQSFQNKEYRLSIQTRGDIIPSDAQIHLENETYFLQNKAPGVFEYTFSQLQKPATFFLSANGIQSRPYTIDVLEVPVLTGFEMTLDYPSYTKKQDEEIKGTGNAIVPEGTTIKWKLNTKQTKKVSLHLPDTVAMFLNTGTNFSIAKQVFNDTDYQISTSNQNIENHEQLNYSLRVIKDAYPELEIMSQTDTLGQHQLFFVGQATDDYGLSGLQVVYYEKGKEIESKQPIKIGKSDFEQFSYSFPNQVELKEGVSYEFYFEVTDNDAIRGGKKTKSQTYTYRKLSESEIKEQQLKQQKEAITNVNNTIEAIEKQAEELKDITNAQKQTKERSYDDRKKLANFLQRQEQQEALMKNFNKTLQENLETFQKEEKIDEEYKKLLQERLERQQKEIEKNEKFLEELKELTDKINNEELTKRLEMLAKKQQNSKRNAEQILELTKRYYVSAKTEKIKNDLNKLSEKQKELSNKEGKENNTKKQDSLNSTFEELKNQIEQLEKDNEDLKKPYDLERDTDLEKQIEKEQKEAKENLQEHERDPSLNDQNTEQQKAQNNQKNAAKKMKQLSDMMQQQMQQAGANGATEDAEALRQILDNLVLFSFDQEALFDDFSNLDDTDAIFAERLRRQNELRELFRHVDDSLFALSLRRPEIAEVVNKEITNTYFNIDKALERLAQGQIYQGIANQQYALTSVNTLADFLSNVLDNLQQSLNGSPGGGGGGMQLPDIIQSQEELNQQMEKGINEGGKEPKSGEKEQGKGAKEGKGTEGRYGEGERISEELYEIFKQQQQIRDALEKQLNNIQGQGTKGQAENLLRQMENIEDELLEKGFNNNTLQKMQSLQHQLLKLENAYFQQGQKEERESKANNKNFTNTVDDLTPDQKAFFNTIEILNRQVLPLRQIYKEKVRTYFKNND